jgi:uncharacterized protein with HEPN domain
MPRRTLKTLEDVRDAVAYILEITAGESQDSYSANRMLRQAVGRNFEIIGEAIRRLRDHDPATVKLLSGYSRIISFRNLLIHGYDLIDDTLV